MKLHGVTHIHSTYSYDGTMSLLEIKQACQERGLSFVCMTEHTDEMTPELFGKFVTECRELSDNDFLFVPGVEIPYGEAHILLIGCTKWVGQKAKDATSLLEASSVSAMTILAHPVRNHFKLDDTMLDVIDGVEVWNQQYDGKLVPRTRSVALLNELQQAHPELRATAGLDLHRIEHMGDPTMTIDIGTLSEPFVLHALTTGSYTFSKTGFSGKKAIKLSFRQKIQSLVSLGIIKAGKFINKQLAVLGISFPKKLKQFVRRFV